jgi:predicted permease
MNDIFVSGFLSMLEALAKIFTVIIIAGILVRKKVITQEQITGLSKATVMVFLPALAFSSTIKQFNPDSLPYWWVVPLIGMGMSSVGFFMASGLFAFDYKKNKNLIAVSSMQNAGYLVLPIGQVVYPERFDEFAIITFLFILGFNPLLWTLGKYLSTSNGQHVKFTYKDLVTPPAIANIISLLIVLIGIQDIFQNFFVDAVGLAGDAAVPVATFILGATLGTVSLKKVPVFTDSIRVLIVKYILMPGLTVFILYYFKFYKINPLMSDFFVIEAAAAPAVGLILQCRTYGGDTERVAAMMLVSYLVCLVTLPFWISFWHVLI